MPLTKEKWEQLETLCREVLDDAPPPAIDHDLYQAVALTGAFAASVQKHMEEEVHTRP